MKYWKSEQFLKLQEKWYKKLKSKGFTDIEYKVPQGCLAGINGTLLQRKSQVERESISEYYSQLTHWAYQMPPGEARTACIMHGEGLSFREIGEHLGRSKIHAYRLVRDERLKMREAQRLLEVMEGDES